MREIEKARTWLYPQDYRCCSCKAELVGETNIVCDKIHDEEGYHWRAFCDTCWDKVKNEPAEKLYRDYPVTPSY